MFVRYKCKAIGSGSEGAQSTLQEGYSDSLTLAEAEALAVSTLKQVRACVFRVVLADWLVNEAVHNSVLVRVPSSALDPLRGESKTVLLSLDGSGGCSYRVVTPSSKNSLKHAVPLSWSDLEEG